jgi:hypothetical protein
MSPDEQSVKHMVAVTDCAIAQMLAQDFNRANVCCGLAVIASMLTGQDADARTKLAHMMLRLARKLDPELVSAKWN